MISVLYTSSAKRPFSEATLAELLAKSRQYNETVGVTGMLLYKDINFMQVVEGPEEAVEALMKRIAGDPRHFGMVTLLREAITEKKFANWSMGFVHVDDATNLPEGFSDIMDRFQPETFFHQPTLAQKVLAGFRDAL